MLAYVLAILLTTIVWAAILYLNETRGLLSCDHFSSLGAKLFAYGWLGFFLIFLGVLVATAANSPARASDLAKAPFYALFELHAILIIFLIGWWAATGRPPLTRFFNIQRDDVGQAVLTGLAVGVGGWIFTIAAAAMIVLILQAAGVLQQTPEPSPVIGFMAALAWWKKLLIVASAMTVEEAFFRSFLQKRIGLVASTLLFALAHFTLGQPLLLIGVFVISLVIGFTFYRTKNVLPGVIAHGVFDAVQLFVIIPIVFNAVGI